MSLFQLKKGKPLEFNKKKSCGLWLIIVGAVIIISALMGADLLMNPGIFGAGYFFGFYIAIGNNKIRSKLSQGERSSFQKKMSICSIALLFLLIIIFTFPFWNGSNVRMIWLGCLLSVGIHFFAFYFVHGKSMLVIAVLCSINAIIGMSIVEIPFIIIALIDGTIKIGFGIFLLFFSKPTISGSI